MKVKWTLEHNTQGCDITGEIDAEPDASDEDIEAAVREDMWNWLSLTWVKTTDVPV